MKLYILVLLISISLSVNFSAANPLVGVVKKIKPSIVGVGVYTPLATIDSQLNGTGFVVGNGKYVVTNEHVINAEFESELKSQRVIFLPNGGKTLTIPVKQIYIHEHRDIAILEIETELSPVTLFPSEEIVSDGQSIAITGFPIGAILGLYPATHVGIVSATTPNIVPAQHSSQMSEKFLKRIDDQLMVYQLDIVAYPGNSGSPVYNTESGDVIGVINQVFVKETKESVLEKPSGITYAIPISEVYKLAQKHEIKL